MKKNEGTPIIRLCTRARAFMYPRIVLENRILFGERAREPRVCIETRGAYMYAAHFCRECARCTFREGRQSVVVVCTYVCVRSSIVNTCVHGEKGSLDLRSPLFFADFDFSFG